MVSKGIFCLEGIWNSDLQRKSTVQPILNMLEVNSGIKYIYQDVATIEELEFYLDKWKQLRYRRYPILYLAFHGEHGLLLIGKKKYTLDRLAEYLERSCSRSILLLASCSTLKTDIRNIKRFLRKTHALAICGYKSEVSWMLAAAFELLVLSALQEIDFTGRGIGAIERRIRSFGELFTKLDFTVVTRKAIIAK
jgi:hypothetical protein